MCENATDPNVTTGCYLNSARCTETNETEIWCQTVRPSMTGEDVYSAFSVCGGIIIIICILGTVCNGLNVFVLGRVIRRPSPSPTYHLLLAMGVADLMAILFYSVYAITMFARERPVLFGDLSEEHSDFIHILMRTWYFPVNIFLLASNWCVVAMTVFRFLAVTFPMKVCRWCTLRRVRVSIVIIFIMSLILNATDWFTVAFSVVNDGRIRGFDTDLYHNLGNFYLVYQVIEIFLPFSINLVLVTALIYNLYKNRFSALAALPGNSAAGRQADHKKIGLMLVMIVVWFLFCYTPKMVIILIRELGPMLRSEIEAHPSYMKASIAADVFMLSNHAGNVIFYCLCNRNYRRMFAMSLLCRDGMLYSSRNGSQRNTSTSYLQAHSWNGKSYIQRYLLEPLHLAPVVSSAERRRSSLSTDLQSQLRSRDALRDTQRMSLIRGFASSRPFDVACSYNRSSSVQDLELSSPT